MVSWRAFALASLFGCGRIDFDPRAQGDADGGGGPTIVGTLDAEFATAGAFTLDYSKDDVGLAVAIDAMGRIVVAGSGNTVFYVQGDQTAMAALTLRLVANGSPDPAYQYGATSRPGLTVDTSGPWSHGEGLVVDANGRPTLCGFREWGGTDDPTLYRYQAASGQPDPTFGTSGITNVSLAGEVEASACAADPVDGSIVVTGGSSTSQAMYLSKVRASDGGLVTAFGGTGTVTYDITGNEAGAGTAVDSNGRIYVAGTVNNGTALRDLVVWRYLDTGVLDGSWGSGGLYRYDGGDDDEARGIAIDASGRVVVAGSTVRGDRDALVLRLDTSGQPDPGFGAGGMLLYDSGGTDAASTVVLAGDASIYVGGAAGTDMFVAKVTPAGVLDPTFGTSGMFRTSLHGLGDAALGLAFATDGLVAVGQTMTSAGFTDLAVWKLH